MSQKMIHTVKCFFDKEAFRECSRDLSPDFELNRTQQQTNQSHGTRTRSCRFVSNRATFWLGYKWAKGAGAAIIKQSLNNQAPLSPVDHVAACQAPLNLAGCSSASPLVRSCEPRRRINTNMAYWRRCCIRHENPG